MVEHFTFLHGFLMKERKASPRWWAKVNRKVKKMRKMEKKMPSLGTVEFSRNLTYHTRRHL